MFKNTCIIHVLCHYHHHHTSLSSTQGVKNIWDIRDKGTISTLAHKLSFPGGLEGLTGNRNITYGVPFSQFHQQSTQKSQSSHLLWTYNQFTVDSFRPYFCSFLIDVVELPITYTRIDVCALWGTKKGGTYHMRPFFSCGPEVLCKALLQMEEHWAWALMNTSSH